MGLDGWIRPLRFRLLIAGTLVLLLVGCGSIGSNDDAAPTPTATVWPTVNDAVEASSPEASPPWQMTAGSPTAPVSTVPGTAATPATTATLPVEAASSSPESVVPGESTPKAESSVPASPAGISTTPSPTETSGSGVTTVESGPTLVPTTEVGAGLPADQAANTETGDGTSGPSAVTDLPARSSSTPVSSPVASPASGARVIVTNCSPADVPAFGDASSSFITTSDVNIRVGPGTDCDLAADILPQGTLLTITSGDVTRDGESGVTWVRVDVDGLEGWISTEFIAPDVP